MAITNRTKLHLEVALADKTSAAEVIADLNQQATTVAAIATADASDLATAITLANANKAKINQVIAALKAAGLMA